MFFALLRFFKSIIIPKPELTSNPERSAPKESEPSTKSSVINKDEAQFGIKPMIEVNNGARYLLL